VAGSGKDSTASSAGDSGFGTSFQVISKRRPFVQGETAPVLLMPARTRHQYSPFGIAVSSVAEVFSVWNLPSSLPSIFELKPASAEIWNS
jgi:hypothetical protein